MNWEELGDFMTFFDFLRNFELVNANEGTKLRNVWPLQAVTWPGYERRDC